MNTSNRSTAVAIFSIVGLLAFAVGCGQKESPPQPQPPTTVGSTTPGAKIVGKVTLLGSFPGPEPVKMDATCSALHTAPVIQPVYAAKSDGGLADTFVYVQRGLEGKMFPIPTETPLLDQVGCLYEPWVSVVWAGQKFQVRNSDPLMHNVHALPTRNKEFNLGQPLKGQINEKVFTEPEVFVLVKCEVHPWMKAYVAVVNHPFYDVTRQDGQFHFPPDLPPGKYTIAAHHPRLGIVTQEIEVTGGEERNVQLALSWK